MLWSLSRSVLPVYSPVFGVWLLWCFSCFVGWVFFCTCGSFLFVFPPLLGMNQQSVSLEKAIYGVAHVFPGRGSAGQCL